MKKILAKLKNDQNVIVFPDADIDALKDLYKIPDTKNSVPFEVNIKKWVEGQWYFIVLTEEQKEEMIGGYVTEAGTMGLDMMTKDQCTEVRTLYMVDAEEMLFTKVASRHIVQSRKYVSFSDKPELAEQGNSIVLTGEVDAYYNGRLLFFKKFASIQTLFPGIKKVYKEATETTTNEFLSSPLFELKEEMNGDFIGLRNRKRIADIVETSAEMLKDPDAFGKYVTYAQDYDLDLEIADSKISLFDNADIQKVLGLFGESFYTTDVTGEKREIGRSKKLVHGKRKRAK